MNYLDASIEVSERGPLTLGPFPPKGAREVVPKHAIVVYHLSFSCPLGGKVARKRRKGAFYPGASSEEFFRSNELYVKMKTNGV